MRDPRRLECTICTAVAPEAVFTVRTYATDRQPTSPNSAHIQPTGSTNPQVNRYPVETTSEDDRSQVSQKGFPLQAGPLGRRIERISSWHNRGFAKLLICTERRTRVIDACIALAKAVIVIRRLRTAWTTPPTGGTPDPADDHDPLAQSLSPPRHITAGQRDTHAETRAS